MDKAQKLSNRNHEAVKDVLLREGLVSEEHLAQADAERASETSSYIDYIIQEGILTKQQIGETMAKIYSLKYVDLRNNLPNRHLVMRIPEEVALRYRTVLYNESEVGLEIASDNPEERGLAEALRELFPEKNITLSYALPNDIDDILMYYSTSFMNRFADIIKRQEHVVPEIVNELIIDALDHRASDLHLDPQGGGEDVIMRMRIDGVLHDAGNIPENYYEYILNRIKVQAKLDIQEQVPVQEGLMRHQYRDKIIEIRVSVMATVSGEAVNMHFITEYESPFTMNTLNMSDADKEIIMKAVKKPYGIVLVTGPTGAGKTTTLYSMIKYINRPDVHIMSIEDPVEYKMLGVNQVQVDPSKNLTYQSALKSILRQDPNVIFIGEIKDEETMNIAVNAALTGHLILTSFYSISAVDAIPRFIEMGIEPFLLTSTLELIVSQRLVRQICPECKNLVAMKRSEIKKTFSDVEKYFPKEEIHLYQGKGCAACENTGYQGRVAVFEVLPMTQKMQSLILSKPDINEIWEVAQSERTHTLFDDGIDKVKQGLTTIEEVKRVVPLRHKSSRNELS